jgi:hypothetical protein
MRMMSSTTLLGVVLTLTIFSAGVVTDRLTNVFITNLPLDEQGNLKIKAAEKQLQTCTDSVRIDVLGWATREWAYAGESKEWGVMVSGDYPANLAFTFSPKQGSCNITEIVVLILATGAVDNFKLNINGRDLSLGNVRLTVDLTTSMRIPVDPNTVQINNGINLLGMTATNPPSYLSVYEVTIFIEYEYLA